MTSEQITISTPVDRMIGHHALLEVISEIVCIVDESGVILYLNGAVESVLGRDPAEEAGSPFWTLAHPDDVETIRGWLARSLPEMGRNSAAVEFRARHRDGSCRTLEARLHPADLSADSPGFVLTARDITEKRCLEAYLRQAQKLEAVGLLAGGIAHDFNNLLTGIKGYADLLLRDPDLRESLRHDVYEIGKAAHRASGLTRQLLAYSRRQDIESKLIDPAAVLADLEELLQRLIHENVEIRTRIPRQIGWVMADRSQFEQIVINLAVNARDAMPRGGRLTLELDELTIDDVTAPFHSPLQPGRYIRLRVSDTGSGMDEEIRGHIFEPFFTTKGPELGTGLGLSNVLSIVRKSGGIIDVESTPGAGTTFEVILPRVQHLETGALPDTAAPASHGGQGSETVLLVEDEAVVRNLIRRVLSARGYQVLTASDGAEARRLAEEFAGEIHILVSDVVMPNLGGGELAQILLQSRPQLRVLLISGHAADSIIPEIDGVRIRFFPKPFTPDALVQIVREILDADQEPSG
jgi:PAS domain S-box-containing protein